MMVTVPADKKPGDTFTFGVPAPVAAVAQAQPAMAVAQAQPAMAVAQAQPAMAVAQAQPAMAVAQAQPMMAVAQAQPMMAAGAVVSPQQVVMAPQQVVVAPVMMAPMPMVMFGRTPVLNTCMFCKQSGPTNVRYEPGLGAHAAALCCCLFVIPLCCIPYSTAAGLKRRLASVTTATISASTRSSLVAQGEPPRPGAQPSSPGRRRAVQPASKRP